MGLPHSDLKTGGRGAADSSQAALCRSIRRVEDKQDIIEQIRLPDSPPEPPPLLLHPVRRKWANESRFFCSASLHVCVTKTPLEEEAAEQSADHAERAPYRLVHDETPSNTNTHTPNTHTHTPNTHTLQEQCYCSVPVREKEPLRLTRTQRLENNAITLSLWIDLRRTRMRK